MNKIQKMIFRKGEFVRVLPEEFLDQSVKKYTNKIGFISMVKSLESVAPFIVLFCSASKTEAVSFSHTELETVQEHESPETIRNLRYEIQMFKVQKS